MLRAQSKNCIASVAIIYRQDQASTVVIRCRGQLLSRKVDYQWRWEWAANLWQMAKASAYHRCLNNYRISTWKRGSRVCKRAYLTCPLGWIEGDRPRIELAIAHRVEAELTQHWLRQMKRVLMTKHTGRPRPQTFNKSDKPVIQSALWFRTIAGRSWWLTRTKTWMLINSMRARVCLACTTDRRILYSSRSRCIAP